MKLSSARLLLTAAIFALLSPSAWSYGRGEAAGQPGVASEASKTVTVELLDNMRFSPENISAKQGETIRFIVTNKGILPHEFVLGSHDELKAHAIEMRTNPHGTHGGADPGAVQVAPKETRELVWKFTRAGTVDFACLLPGHFEAGMTGKVKVAKR